MSTVASQITSLTTVYSTVYSGADKKNPKLRFTGLCEGNSPVTGQFPPQRTSDAENVSIWWRHHVCLPATTLLFCRYMMESHGNPFCIVPLIRNNIKLHVGPPQAPWTPHDTIKVHRSTLLHGHFLIFCVENPDKIHISCYVRIILLRVLWSSNRLMGCSEYLSKSTRIVDIVVCPWNFRTLISLTL